MPKTPAANAVLARKTFFALLKSEGLPVPEYEFKFHPKRRWRADYCWPDPYWLILEVEGGVWTGGRHTRGYGFAKDMEKYNAAAVLGYRLLRCEPRKLVTATTLETIRIALLQSGG